MTIGGTDCTMLVPRTHDAHSSILAIGRRLWPDGVFVDGDDTDVIPLASPALDARPPSREFFLFRDRETEAAWDELGPCPENWNRMLHFLIVDRQGADGPTTELTVVVDEVTPEIQQMLTDLELALRRPPTPAVA